jgi:hypothetical protein
MTSNLIGIDYYSLPNFDTVVKRDDGYVLIESNCFSFGSLFKVKLMNGVFYTDSFEDAIDMAYESGQVVKSKRGEALQLHEIEELVKTHAIWEIVIIVAVMLALFIPALI